jgi:hypothetical protein
MSNRTSRVLPAWVGGFTLGAACLPGLCPACWPGYIGLVSSAGVGAAAPWIRSTAVFAVLIVLATAPLALQIFRRRAWDATLTALTGAALLIEARWLGGSTWLQTLGTILLVASAIASTSKPAPAAPALINITRREEPCARPC